MLSSLTSGPPPSTTERGRGFDLFIKIEYITLLSPPRLCVMLAMDGIWPLTARIPLASKFLSLETFTSKIEPDD